MTAVLALALSVALLGGIATWLFVTAGTLLIWAAFVAWACFYHSGGDLAAVKSTIVSNTFGVFVAATTGLLITSIDGGELFGSALWISIAVGGSIVFYILASNLTWFSNIPGTTYGYACTFAFLTQNPSLFNSKSLLSLGLHNAYLIVPLSMTIGTVFAYTSARLALALTAPRIADA